MHAYIYCMCKKVGGLIQGRIICCFEANKALIKWFCILQVDTYISLNEAKYVHSFIKFDTLKIKLP